MYLTFLLTFFCTQSVFFSTLYCIRFNKKEIFKKAILNEPRHCFSNETERTKNSLFGTGLVVLIHSSYFITNIVNLVFSADLLLSSLPSHSVQVIIDLFVADAIGVYSIPECIDLSTNRVLVFLYPCFCIAF